MSSAAKLRYIGRGTAVVASAALVMTSFGPAAFAAWDDAPQTPNVNEASTIEDSETEGTIGIKDTNTSLANNQGATLVQAGANDQPIADTMFTLPNRFKAGDVIELHLLDRQVSEENDYKFNSGPSMAVGFSGAPTVAVDAAPKSSTAEINPDSDITDPVAAWAAAQGSTVTKPGVAPSFSVATRSSNGGPGQNVLRLTVTSEASTGDPDGRWVVNLSDLKVNLGSAVTPGALRLVPFSINADGNATEWFCENAPYSNNDTTTPTDDTMREIGIYTVPAYVAPAKIAAETSIIADGSSQNIGDLTIAETQPYSLGDGLYTLRLSGATIANTATSQVKVAVTNGGTNETATVTNISQDGTTLTFRLSNTDATKASTLAVSGLQLRSSSPQPITWTLAGDSLNAFMSTAGQGAQVRDAAGNTLVRDEASFLSETGTQPYNTVVDDPAVATDNTAGADLTQQEAGKFVTPAGGSQTVNVTWTGGTPQYAITDGAGDAATGIGADPVIGDPTVTDPVSAANLTLMGGDGTYTVTASPAVNEITTNTAGVTMTQDTLNGLAAGPYTTTYQTDGTRQFWTLSDGTTTWNSINGTDFWTGGDSSTYTVSGTNTFDLTGIAPSAGAFTVAQDEPASWTLATPNGTTATSTDGTTFTGDFDGDASTAATTVTFTLPTGVSALETGTFQVADTGTAATWALVDAEVIGADGTEYTDVTYTSTDGVTFTKEATAPAGAPATITFAAALSDDATSSFVVQELAAELDCGVWQKDILAPANALRITGGATAGTASIGGSNRFGTAARIAHEYVRSTGLPNADTAIIVNGMSAPDALSSSFLSQREGAPILLTAPGQLPAETVEALRDLGVRKVYIVGGRTAVGGAVFDALKAQDAYMWDAAAKAIKPRGDKLEVVQLGGDNRYQTNWRVNTYAAAQTAAAAPVGKISVGYGQALKTTAMVARSSTANDFVDALSASVLSAGRAGGLSEVREAGAVQLFTVTTGSFGLAAGANVATLAAGQYRLVDGGAVQRYDGTNWAPVGTYTANDLTIAGVVYPLSGVAASGNAFTVSANPEAGAQFGYDTTVGRVNALPVILTQPTQLVDEAASQMRALHIEHALLIGGDSALAPAVNDQVAKVGATSYRIGGADRWETAANVNRFAMNPQTVTAAGQTPGLGFDGGHIYSDAVGTNRVGGEMVSYLANGLKFPDALVAGPWVSRTRNTMLMTLQNDLPAPSATFISEKAAQIDRAAGLGQGAAVSSAVIVEANQIASSK
ncbi:cell wall-binding repeat-containing protein [Mobilicoccus caccae]|uniref:Cell wall binding repeat 2 n=1 Tax=Mobilicoccus caccae TaxID=1859295 RepID=A0ABQ6IND1_9MICO|nr:cell wall-binding repeat-containing protein [Mobilicoccus caccae]GMA38611.1 hypothetical protein GCM10025883_06560 [Mobilicoccus caccae]